jgi:hypothetical protein
MVKFGVVFEVRTELKGFKWLIDRAKNFFWEQYIFTNIQSHIFAYTLYQLRSAVPALIFNNYILPMKYIYGFHMIIRINSDYFLERQ